MHDAELLGHFAGSDATFMRHDEGYLLDCRYYAQFSKDSLWSKTNSALQEYLERAYIQFSPGHDLRHEWLYATRGARKEAKVEAAMTMVGKVQYGMRQIARRVATERAIAKLDANPPSFSSFASGRGLADNLDAVGEGHAIMKTCLYRMASEFAVLRSIVSDVTDLVQARRWLDAIREQKEVVVEGVTVPLDLAIEFAEWDVETAYRLLENRVERHEKFQLFPMDHEITKPVIKYLEAQGYEITKPESE